MDDQQKTITFSGDEYLKILGIVEKICSKASSESEPQFVIVMGGVGVGKTTIRHEKYNDYVNFEFGEIFNIFKKEFGEDDPKLTAMTSVACDLILNESIEKKKNIVTELIGDKEEDVRKLIDGMLDLGYKVSPLFITADPAESYKRHLKLVDENKDYLSAHFTQDTTMSFFFHKFENN